MDVLRILHLMPRVGEDIESLLHFISRQPRGKPEDRRLDVHRGVEALCRLPQTRRNEAYRPESRIWLRRWRAAQFVIIYAYVQPRDPSLPDLVTIRAVKHVREANVFEGVREPQVRSSIGTNLRFSGPM